jgi:hypothetical protein
LQAKNIIYMAARHPSIEDNLQEYSLSVAEPFVSQDDSAMQFNLNNAASVNTFNAVPSNGS